MDKKKTYQSQNSSHFCLFQSQPKVKQLLVLASTVEGKKFFFLMQGSDVVAVVVSAVVTDQEREREREGEIV